ncbi:hypothetical protein EGW08_012770, partial [Elysia chlorotica]
GSRLHVLAGPGHAHVLRPAPERVVSVTVPDLVTKLLLAGVPGQEKEVVDPLDHVVHLVKLTSLRVAVLE